MTGDKSTSRKFALFVRLGGERKAHTYDMRCYQQLLLSDADSKSRGNSPAFLFVLPTT
jgi:hypothetical protein